TGWTVGQYRMTYTMSSYAQNWSISYYAYTTPRRGYTTGPTNPAFKGGLSDARLSADCNINSQSWFQSVMNQGTDAALHAFRHPGTTANFLYWDGHVQPHQPKAMTGKNLYEHLFAGNPTN